MRMLLDVARAANAASLQFPTGNGISRLGVFRGEVAALGVPVQGEGDGFGVKSDVQPGFGNDMSDTAHKTSVMRK